MTTVSSANRNNQDEQVLQQKTFCKSLNTQMNRMYDKNQRRSQGGRKSLQRFITLRLRLVSISSVFVGTKTKNG